MPNLCDYDMKIKGSKEAIQRVIDCLKANYDYEEGKPAHKHFFRVFDCYDEDEFMDEGNGIFSKYVFGDCAWAINCCMISGYYEEVKKNHPKIFMGTTLAEQSKDCEIEVFSEEPGCCFSEHYIYKNGECLLDDCVEIEQGGYGEDGKPTTDIDWDTYDGDYLIFNDHRDGLEGSYKWEI